MDRTLAEEMYKEHVLDLYQNPHNYHELENATHTHFDVNESCGDEITIELIIENNVVKDAAFKGKGCAIHMASASLITDAIKDKTIEDIEKITPEDMLDLLKIPISPGRLKCALLALESIKNAVRK